MITVYVLNTSLCNTWKRNLELRDALSTYNCQKLHFGWPAGSLLISFKYLRDYWHFFIFYDFKSWNLAVIEQAEVIAICRFLSSLLYTFAFSLGIYIFQILVLAPARVYQLSLGKRDSQAKCRLFSIRYIYKCYLLVPNARDFGILSRMLKSVYASKIFTHCFLFIFFTFVFFNVNFNVFFAKCILVAWSYFDSERCDLVLHRPTILGWFQRVRFI